VAASAMTYGAVLIINSAALADANNEMANELNFIELYYSY
jgi:hypothetical protein